jgi:hypothetical protein
MQLMEYCELLDKADECEDPYMRMVYACEFSPSLNLRTILCHIMVDWALKSIFFSATWAVSVYFAYQRTWKPFNPILGETYEMVNHQGITFLAEQVGDTNVIADILNGDNFVNKFC